MQVEFRSHFLAKKKCILWAGKYAGSIFCNYTRHGQESYLCVYCPTLWFLTSPSLSFFMFSETGPHHLVLNYLTGFFSLQYTFDW